MFIYDIETKPNTVRTFGLRNQNIGINQIVDPGGMICWAGMWYGDKPEFHRGPGMVQTLWDRLHEADVVVGYNHIAFDNKIVRGEFAIAGMTPPSPWKDVDLLRVVRQNFRFPPHKLDFVAGQLGLGHKVQHSGFDLWQKCLADDPKRGG